MIQVDAFTFSCEGKALLGLAHRPEKPAAYGLLIMVGGPQYRVGAHRQYVHLARRAADAGIAAMRFDYRGVGDSEGDYPGFEHIGPDIAAAVNEFRRRVPKLHGVVLWGLCEGASAILLSGVDVPGVSGAVLVNPWVHTEGTAAKTVLKHYYGQRLFDKAAWKRLLSGQVDVLGSIKGVLGLFKRMASPRPVSDQRPYPDRMADGLRRFKGRTLLLLSDRDLVAREFEDVAASAPAWAGVMAACQASRATVANSDHTFSSEVWRQGAAEATIAFIRSLEE
ncbi:MAG: hydrolase 1, exosortase A system-associated [Sphingomonadales bacterium]|nr:hydrolase 1, exosortase A system-associated [Sphingomonadales bacterium]